MMPGEACRHSGTHSVCEECSRRGSVQQYYIYTNTMLTGTDRGVHYERFTAFDALACVHLDIRLLCSLRELSSHNIGLCIARSANKDQGCGIYLPSFTSSLTSNPIIPTILHYIIYHIWTTVQQLTRKDTIVPRLSSNHSYYRFQIF